MAAAFAFNYEIIQWTDGVHENRLGLRLALAQAALICVSIHFNALISRQTGSSQQPAAGSLQTRGMSAPMIRLWDAR